jgi:hypothetical protein
MLAQNFLDARALDIPEDLRDALVAVLGQLERGELRHLRFTDATLFKMEMTTTAPDGFSMALWGDKHLPDCGTPACIGGWCQQIIGRKINEHFFNKPIEVLFYPNSEHPPEEYDYEAITPSQAARALRHYLTRGAPNWAEALQDD